MGKFWERNNLSVCPNLPSKKLGDSIFNQVFLKKNLVHSLAKVAGLRAGVRRPHFTITLERLFLLISFLGDILLWGKGRFHSIFGVIRFSTLPPGGQNPETQKP
jgi:hypothetical protein